MNVIKGNWFNSILLAVVGIVLCCLYSRPDTLIIIIYILGALFTATGCINIIVTSLRQNKGTSGSFSTTIGWLAGLGGIGLGAVMLIVPHDFTSILGYVFAGLLILGGLYHFIIMATYNKSAGLQGWLYFLPLLLVVAGVVIFCSSTVRNDDKVTVLISGIGAILFSLTTLLEYIYSKAHDRHEQKVAKAQQAQVAASTATAEETTDVTPADDSHNDTTEESKKDDINNTTA